MSYGWAEKIAVAIKNKAPEQTASVEVMKFALISLFNGTTVLVACLLIGGITGKLTETIITMIAFAVMRFIAGGFHFESALACFLFSTALLSALPHIPLPDGSQIYLSVISIVLLLIFAPSDVKGKTRIPEKYFLYLKLSSILLVCGNIVIDSDLLLKAFFAASLLTVKLRR